MNSLVFPAVLLLAVGAMAQYRPFYAGSGVNYPRPFATGGSDDGLADRFGATDPVSRVDANGHDVKLVDDAAKLPAEQQPFWYLNREHIRKHLGLDANAPTAGTVQLVQPVQTSQPIVVRPIVGLPLHPVQPAEDPEANIA